MKQHATPVIIKDGKAESLVKERLKSTFYNEDWIQDLCFKYPNLLPITELEPTFSEIIPICRELPVESGYVDLLYINEYGFITIGECKLWRNPDARRKVVGQILDYAKDLAKWDYSKFESACLKAGKRDEKTLFEIIQSYYPETDEVDFIDNVQKNLTKGRFLLLIIGDGIQENMEDLVEYIHRKENLHFTLGLIELPIYKNQANEIVITPRILARTKEIERIIYRISDKNVEEDNSIAQETERSTTISEEVYFERLEKNIGIVQTKEFKQWLAELSLQLNIKTSLGRSKTRSISLKSPDGSYNFATIFEEGNIYFYGLGRKKIGVNYLKKLSHAVHGQFDSHLNDWHWGVRKENGKPLNIIDCLPIKDKWVEVLTETMKEIYQSEENE